MKKLYVLLVISLFTTLAKAQPYCNEWIRFAINNPYSLQQYLKIQVWQEGIHKITFNDINQFIPANSFNPHQIQIFHNGKEQYINVTGESDNVFDTTDYIEFYGKRNDGSFDAQLYDSAQFQPNPYYSMFNDTSAYFFTINADPLALNKRIIVENDNNFSNYPPVDFVIKNVWQEYHSRYQTGYSEPSVDASYSNGEGYSSGNFGADVNYNLTLPTPNPYAGSNPNAPLPFASTILIGTNTGGDIRNWTLNINNIPYATYSYYGYTVNHFDQTLSAFPPSVTSFSFIPAVTNTYEGNSVPYISMRYAHTLSFSGETGSFQKFTVKGDATAAKTRLDITGLNTNPNTRWLYVFSGDTIKKLNVDSSSTYQTLVQTFGTDKECLLTTEDATLTTGHIVKPVSTSSDPAHYARLTNFMFNGGASPDYNFLMISHKSLWTEAINYKDYRNSAPGGGHKVLLADIDDLYDEFAYGINKHPQSIRNFCKFALDTFAQAPEYLFLLGKSIMSENSRNDAYYYWNLVPTYGDPPSDMIFTSRLYDNIFHPAIATGRLAAWHPADVTAYLNKVKEHDEWLTKPPEEWMKQILHFGGGSNAYEQDQIKMFLNQYKDIIEDTLFAGHVTSFFKTSTDPIQANLSQGLQNLIDTGVTIMTFFSHAAGSTFDITTDVPENYHNQGRYPLIIANSCYIGNIHTIDRQASEDFVLIPNKGAIGFIASPNIGFIAEQPPYTEPLLRNIASYEYGQSIGKCMKDAIDSVSAASIGELAKKSMTMGMTLNGDPSLKLYSQQKPDLAVSRPGVFFTPADITTEVDSFNINVVVKNLGISIDRPYVLEVTRSFPDGGNTRIFDVTLTKMPFEDTISIVIPMDLARASGLNLFSVFVDAGFPSIDEVNENNNRVDSIPLIIRSSDITPVYPFKYSIIPNSTVTLKASTANLFAPLRAYRFELDTTDRFTSPFKKAYDTSSVGGIVEWQLPFILEANKVYYWRVANAAILQDTANYHWNESSFIYIPGKTGWSQAHYSQFKEDQFQNINYANGSVLDNDTTFKFVSVASTVVCHNSLTPDELGGHPVDYYINNGYMACCGCSFAQFSLVVLDSITLAPWTADNHDLGNKNKYDIASGTGFCATSYAPRYFLYPSDSVAFVSYRDSLAGAMTNLIPNGDYILLYTVGGGKYSWWDTNLVNAFASLSPTIPSAANNEPFIYFTKKGSGVANVMYANSSNPDITFSTVIGGNWNKGFINSVTIGPASQWSELHWGQNPLEASPGQDSIDVSVIGIDSSKQETVLVSHLPKSVPDYSLSTISAHTYPYLKLQAYVQDTILHTPPQLNRWQIYYDEVPEAALAPNKWFKPVPFIDTIAEGGNINLEMAIENISSKNMDSMLVDFYVFDKNHVRSNVSSPRYRPLPSGDTLHAKVTFNTRNYTGLNSLWIEANPRNDQPEQYHFNNLAEILFTVNRDITNPILDVTFDGQHILDGDIVSAKPYIYIKVKDENKFIAMNDTSAFPVKVTDPNGKVSRIYFESMPGASVDQSKLKWTPAVLPDNSFKIEYNPVFAVDGIYQLDVQGSDAAGNLSGSYAYHISFEIINRSTITDFINYPNPFSNQTKFVFTLTGSEIPTGMKIQIMTVTGKIIREIMLNELGNIHIGRNITEYAWDGKDEFGDQLANGLYLYRVTSQLNGQSIEHRETEADHFFKKGWGKMYLIR
jgi:hypothetical protein